MEKKLEILREEVSNALKENEWSQLSEEELYDCTRDMVELLGLTVCLYLKLQYINP